eukprot:13611533-Ditylum_brightwellii.AAC.1
MVEEDVEPQMPPSKTKKEPNTFDVHYCWMHGITTGSQHTSANCDNPANGHHHKTTLFNRLDSSMK